jgi:hypothetical protein
MLFFAQKYLTRYTFETFFEEFITFQIFRYFRHCGFIPVQSFGSHIRPQPPRLGLNLHFWMGRGDGTHAGWGGGGGGGREALGCVEIRIFFYCSAQ